MIRRTSLLLGPLLLLACNCNTTSSAPAATPAAPKADTVRPAKAPPLPTGLALPAIPAPDPREQAIAIAIRELLQSEHLRAQPIDDRMAPKICERFIEYLDPGKLFLLEAQVKAISSQANTIDDELAAGKLRLARLAGAMLQQQRIKVAAMVEELLQQPFDFSKEESLEADADKRTHPKSEAELKDLWRKTLKQQALERVARMQDASAALEKAEAEAKGKGKGAEGKAGKADGPDDEESAKSANAEPLPKTDAEREQKARTDLATTYAARFKRMTAPQPLAAVETFVNAVSTSFDPHTNYLAPEDQANFDIQMSGSLEGIGAVLTERDHYIEIREVVPGGAAWRQGELEAGDLILAVKQQKARAVDVTDMRLNDVVKMIRGPKGTLVTLSVRKPDERVVSIEIERDVIVVEASYARGALLDLGKGYDPVGYIYLPSFYGNTRTDGRTPERNATDDVRALLQRFKAKKVQSVLLDLRDNGGGLLSHATGITGLFIEEGPVVAAGASGDRMRVQADHDGKIYFEGNVVALVNRFSASAAEILAGALQDYHRALVVGTGPTHGKGTVQMLIDLNRVVRHEGKPLGVLKLTVQQYFLVDGESTQLRGVRPDVVLPDPASFVESGERFLDDAIPWSAVDPLPHTPWSKAGWSVDKLIAASKIREEDNPVFATIKRRGEYLQKRRDDTQIPLRLEAFRARRDENEKALEGLDPKLEEQPERFEVEVVEYRKAPPQPKASARVDTGERLAKWRKELARDPWVSESLQLLHAMTAP